MQRLILIGVMGVVITAGAIIFALTTTQQSVPINSLPVGDFRATSTETNHVLSPGESRTFKIRIQSLSGFDADVRFGLNYPVSGVRFEVTPSIAKVPKDGEVVVDATLAVLKDARPGNRNISIKIVTPTVFHTINGTVNIIGAGKAVIEIGNIQFTPKNVTVRKGTMITWVNLDSIIHTSTSDKGVWDSGDIVAQKSWNRMFEEIGTYEYHCKPHPFQTGSIIVVA